MAKYDITFSCGHNGTVELFGKDKDRKWRLERYRDFGICDECLKKSRDEENDRALREAKEMGLPELLGTEKQISWATTIRQGFMVLLRNKKFSNDNLKEKTMDLFQIILKTKIKASWWIDKRGNTLDEILNSEYEQIQKVNIKNIDNSTLAEQSKDEMTISAENVIHDGRVEVIINENEVKAIYEKNMDFISIVKELGYKWNGTVWYRNITEFTGSSEDRAGELIHKLINGGFRVFTTNDNAKYKAINSTFEPENDYWIIKVDDKIGIKMFIHNDNIYQKSRKLNGSRWDSTNRCVTVSVIYYNEILEFGRAYNFSISKKAKQLIESQILKDNNNIIVNTKEIVSTNYYDYLDTIIESSYNIIEDLKDD